MTADQNSLSYSGDENPSGMAVPPGMQAVVDTQLDLIARAFSEVLNIETSVAGQQDAWLHRLLRETIPLAHEIEKLVAILVACALNADWPERQIAASMSRPVSDLSHWKTPDAQATVAGATGQDLGDLWNMASAEAYLNAQSATEDAEDARRRVYRLMCLLLLHDTPSYMADSLTWVDDNTRRCIKDGWFLQARRAAGTANGVSESAVKPKSPARQREAGDTRQTRSA